MLTIVFASPLTAHYTTYLHRPSLSPTELCKPIQSPPDTRSVSHTFSCTFSAGIWKDRLIAKARASPGRIIFPTKNKADIKGTTHLPLPPVKILFTPFPPPSVLPPLSSTIHPIPSVLTPCLVSYVQA